MYQVSEDEEIVDVLNQPTEILVAWLAYPDNLGPRVYMKVPRLYIKGPRVYI